MCDEVSILYLPLEFHKNYLSQVICCMKQNLYLLNFFNYEKMFFNSATLLFPQEYWQIFNLLQSLSVYSVYCMLCLFIVLYLIVYYLSLLSMSQKYFTLLFIFSSTVLINTILYNYY